MTNHHAATSSPTPRPRRVRAALLAPALLLSSMVAVFQVGTVHANPGDLDSSLGSAGTVRTDLGTTSSDTATAIAVQSDGKYVAVGESTAGSANGSAALVRYNADGSLDTTFGSNATGKVTLQPPVLDNQSPPQYATAYKSRLDAVQVVTAAGPQQGDIYVAGGATFNDGSGGLFEEGVLGRFTSNGVVDTSFGHSGWAVLQIDGFEEFYGLTVQTDGSIVVGSNNISDPLAARYTSAGVLDTGFDAGGALPGTVTWSWGTGGLDFAAAVAFDSTSNSVYAVGGYSDNVFGVVRITSAGAVDTSFGGGPVTTSFGGTADAATAVAVQSNGEVVVAGQGNDDIAVARYTTTGALDTGFNSTGKFTAGMPGATATGVGVQSDSKIVVVGRNSTPDVAVVRLDGNGTLDGYFGAGSDRNNAAAGSGKTTVNVGPGATDDEPAGVAIESGTLGKIDVVGTTGGPSNPDFFVARLFAAYPPAVTTDPTDQTVCAGNTATFTAAASGGTPTGNPAPSSTQWQVSTDSGSSFSNIAGATGGTYTTSSTTASDNGKEYRAVFTNSGGSVATTAATLTVNSAPAVTLSPTTQTDFDNESVTLHSTATGQPTPGVQWQVSTDSGSTFNDVGGATSPDYTATHPTSDSGNQYQAVYTNSCGSDTTTPATLTIIHPTTTTAVTSSAGPSAYGQAVTWTATVSKVPGGDPVHTPPGTPTGTVQFTVDGADYGSPVALAAGGTAQSTPADGSLPIGDHTVTAVYSGDSAFTGGTSPDFTQTVSKGDSVTVVLTPDSPSKFGEPVTFHATVDPSSPAAGTPTGTVTFAMDGTQVGSAVTLASGAADSDQVTPATVGDHTVTATYSGDTNFNTSDATPATQHVDLADTTTGLTSTVNPTVYGQTTTFTAQVDVTAPGAGSPTGTVTFYDGATPLATQNLDSTTDQAMLSVGSLSAGPHTISAVYNGDTDFGPSTSNNVQQAVNQGDTTTVLQSSQNPAPPGTPVQFTATVTANSPAQGTPTGTVTFTLDGSTIGSPVALDPSGQAQSGTVTPSSGAHTVKALYSGDGNFAASNDQLTQTTTQPTTTALSYSSATPVVGQPLQIFATVTPVNAGAGTPDGTVTFTVDGVDVATAPVVNGVATSPTITNLDAAAHAVAAAYSGSNTFDVSNATGQLTVSPASTHTAVGTPSTPSLVGQPVTFTATVTADSPSGATPAGSVSWTVDGTPAGSPVTLSNGTATSAPISTLTPGDHVVVAHYAGTSDFTGSDSANGTQHVDVAPTSTSLASSANPSQYGQPVTFTATVTRGAPAAGAPGGSVQFSDGAGTVYGTVALGADGSASLVLSTFDVGTVPVVATYAGDAGDAGSTSSTLQQRVQATTTSISLQSSKNPSTVGDQVTYTATLTPTFAGPTGPVAGVQFSVDGTPSGGPVSLDVNDHATFVTNNLGLGAHVIGAQFVGDTHYLGSATTYTENVNPTGTTSVVVNAPSPSVLGQPVTLTATVTSATSGTPTGQVTFFDNGNALGTVALDNTGTASLTLSNLGIGNHPITASYAGDGSFLPSTSSVVTQTVDPADTATTLGSSDNPSVVGQATTLTAAVTPVAPGAGTPDGSVQFVLDGTPLASPTALVNGIATTHASFASAGPHTVTVSYLGSPSYNGSNAQPLQQTVNPADTVSAVNISPTNPVFDAAPTFTVTVQTVAPGSGTPGGVVHFTIDGTPYPDGALSNGVATLAGVSGLSAGSHSVDVQYGGAPDYNASSVSTTLDIAQAASSVTTPVSTARPSAFGQAVSFHVDVQSTTATTPTGTVQFVIDGADAGAPVALSSGGADSAPISTLSVGDHTVTASYSGDTDFLPSSSPLMVQHVSPSASATTVSTSSPSVFGQTVTLTATVAPTAPGAGTPSGTVQFVVDGNLYGAWRTLSGGTASIDISSLSVGNHTVAAQYNGDPQFGQSVSSDVPQVVDKAATTVAVTPDATRSFGQTVTLQAQVFITAPGAGTPTGSITFKDGSTTIGTGTVAPDGTASMTISSLNAGDHTITGIYGGDGNFTGSTSPQAVQHVIPAATTTVTVSSANPSVVGQQVKFTATVTSAPGVPTGTIQFSVDGVDLGTPVTMSGGSATSPATAPLALGDHSVSAVFASADGNYATSTGPLTQHVNPVQTIEGYWMVTADGGIFPFGNAQGHGSTGNIHLNQPIVGMAATPDGGGYWLVASDGGIFPFGNAFGFGSMGGSHLNRPIVGMASSPSGNGYWLVASDGGVFPFGDAGGYGSTGGMHLNQPIVGMASTPSGHGYWLVAADGGIFPFGDAVGYGSTGAMHLNRPIVGMAATPDGAGYWLVASDGGIFPFGDAAGFGSTGGMTLNQPIVGMAATPDGLGYWLVASDGGIFPFGDAAGLGSLGGTHLNQPVVGMAATPPQIPAAPRIARRG